MRVRVKDVHVLAPYYPVYVFRGYLARGALGKPDIAVRHEIVWFDLHPQNLFWRMK